METGLISDLEKQYPNEWLLIDIIELDDIQTPLSGKLLGHSPSRDAIDEYALTIKDKIKFPCIMWTGRKPMYGHCISPFWALRVAEKTKTHGGRPMEIGTITEFEKKYPNEWILVDILELDEQNEPKTGQLLGHSPSRQAIYDYAKTIDMGFPFVEWTAVVLKRAMQSYYNDYSFPLFFFYIQL